MDDTDHLSDLEIFSKSLDGEAGNQGYRGQYAIACVIMKRLELKWQHETTIRGICLHPYQFSCWLPGRNRDRIMCSTDPQCTAIAKLAMDNKLDDITGGADSYIVRGTPCYWANKLIPTASIGAHDFYKTR